MFNSVSADTSKPVLLLYEYTPEPVMKAIREYLPDYEIGIPSDNHYVQFLQSTGGVLAYDVEAKALIDSGADYYFYPLYNDVIAIAVDREQTNAAVSGWEDIKLLKGEVSFPEEEPLLRYIWGTLSYVYTEEIKHETPVKYLKSLHDENRLTWDNSGAAIQISFLSTFFHQIQEKKDLEIIIPKEGSLSFKVGILSHHPIDEKIIKNIKDNCKMFNYSYDSIVTPGIILQKDFMELGQLLPRLRRNILGIRKYAPAGVQGHHLASLILIILIIGFTVQTQKRVIHTGLRYGLLITGILLIGWISLGIFKYSLHGYPPAAHFSWYAYYIFSLSLPIVSLFIAENSDKVDGSQIPLWLRVACFITLIFMLLVLTNDYHQWIFRFLTSEPELRGDEYAYAVGFTLLSIWYIAVQFYAFFLMLKKGWDSPKRKMTAIPMVVFIMGILYSITYNMNIPISHDIPLALGMSTIALLFWVTAVYSGLIPTNRGYYELFESSDLNMQILDHNENVKYGTIVEPFIPISPTKNFIETDEKASCQIDDVLIWSSPISGGKVITQENITELSKLRQTLEETVKSLENENAILSSKEQIESRLILLNEQNRLAEEANKIIKDELHKVEMLLDTEYHTPLMQSKVIQQIRRIVLYCKRRCELLIKSKKDHFVPTQELCRVIHETSAVMPEGYKTFCAMDGFLTYKFAEDIYEYYHRIIGMAYEEDITTMTLRLYKKDEFFIYIILEENAEDYFTSLMEFFGGNELVVITKKDLGDSTSFTIKIKERGENLAGDL